MIAVEKITFAKSSFTYWGRLDLTVGEYDVSACQVENVHL